jgi:hypothetical protein
MNPVENTVCLACKLPVVLTYLPAVDPMIRDQWTCPHCLTKYPSIRLGMVVLAVKGD